ncbi:MAG: serine/threonine protein kinase [Planctomycetes bacterium]|nr:serine/threonine protein kinase [Planctomycetota bacterium]
MTCLVLQPGFEPFPGYVLKDKLGSGGYGEVWSADAPGGLTKAIKFVFGSIDDQRGSTELRSLNRMRKLNHPFLLSIERVEVVDSQLVIVTELAQGSLYDRFLEYREKGYIGIPQERLLRYLADAADGLDYLCQEHGLQHLDVKPGNLLLVADRVKVADFGLIKNLQTVSQSAKNGLTPMYAAPEMFDGRPSPSSDQYSLAVAYIELLSGNLPFRGRTCAQLANEHLNKAPNLDSIPVIERPVLAKALAKKPIMRFGSCREFVRALEDCRTEKKSPGPKLKSRFAPGESRNAGDIQGGKRPDQGDNANPSPESVQQSDGIRAKNAKPLRLLSPLSPLASNDKTKDEKVLFIGLGGTGGSAIQLLRMRYEQSNPTAPANRKPRTLYIDTDGESIEQLTSMRNLQAIPHEDTLTIRLQSAQYFRHCKSPDVNRISRRWIYNIPRSQKTEGVRPLGLLAFLDNARQCYETLVRSIEGLFEDSTESIALKVYLMTSAHGGTGGSILCEIGYLLRHIALSLELPIEIQAMLLCASSPEKGPAGLEVASAVACLEEIEKHFSVGGLHEPLQSIPHYQSFNQVPFDQVTLLYGGVLGQKRDWLTSIENLVDYVRSQEQTDLGKRLLQAREGVKESASDEEQQHDHHWLSAVGFRRLNLPSHSDSIGLANRGCLDALNNWTTLIKKQIGDTQALEHHRKIVKNAPSDLAWTNDLFRGQQLSPTPWIRRVIAALAPLENKPLLTVPDPPSTRVTDQPPAMEWGLSDDEIEDIEAIASQLNYDPEKAKQAILYLLSSSTLQLWAWIEQSVLSTLSGWKHFGKIMGGIEQRFDLNIERITTVARQIKEKREAILEDVYYSDQARIPDVDLTLDTMLLEIRFHVLAANLQSKLETNLNEIAARWLRQSLRMLGEMTEVTAQLMTELGIQQTGFEDEEEITGLILNPFYCEAIKFLRDSSYSRLSDCWNLPPDSRRRVAPECKEIRGLVRHVACTQPPDETNSDSTILNGPSRAKGTAGDMNFFQDRFGWNAIFRSRSEGDNTEDGAENSEASQSINSNLTDEFRRALPKLMKSGGAVRNILMIGSRIESILEPTHFQQIKNCRATTISDPIPTRCSIFSIGEQINLSELIQCTWTPNPALDELVRRLKTSQVSE